MVFGFMYIESFRKKCLDKFEFIWNVGYLVMVIFLFICWLKYDNYVYYDYE